MTRKVTDEQYGQLCRWLGEVARRVDEGTIPFQNTMDALQTQTIAESRFSNLPTEMTIADRIYDILGFLRGDEKSVVGHTMVERAKEMNANLGDDDGQHLLDHQSEIPVALRDKVVFVFTGWRRPDDSEHVYCVYWDDDRWVVHWRWLGRDFYERFRVLRRKN